MTGPREGYDSALTAIRNGAENLAVALATWQARDDTRPDAHARRAASGAVDAVDAMLQALHAIRARLISEIRASDDATAIRADKLLAGRNPDDFPGPSGPGDNEAGRLRCADWRGTPAGHPAGTGRAAVTALRGKYSPDNPVAYGAPVRCPRCVPGEKITSAVQGTNADLLRQAAKLWICPDDKLIDVTAGNGTFWAGTDVQPVRSDIRLLRGIGLIADCRKLPYPNASMDVVAFDPPYQPVHGQTERSFGVGRSYGLTENRAIADAYFEAERDRLQAAAGEDPMARVRAEQALRDAAGVRGEGSSRARDRRKGGKGGRGGV